MTTAPSRPTNWCLCDRERVPEDVVGCGRSQRPASDILDPLGIWAANDLYREGRAAATIERAETGIRELGRGKDFLVVYYGTDRAGGWQSLDRPLRTLTTLDRFGLVQWERNTPTLRMLQVPEIKRAMGLPPSFRLERGTRRDKVKLLGNGVCAPVMEMVVRSLTQQGASPYLMAPSSATDQITQRDLFSDGIDRQLLTVERRRLRSPRRRNGGKDVEPRRLPPSAVGST